MEALKAGSLIGVLPLPSGSFSSEPHAGPEGKGGGAASGGGGAVGASDGSRNGLLDANSAAEVRSVLPALAEPTGFRLIAEGDGGWGCTVGE